MRGLSRAVFLAAVSAAAVSLRAASAALALPPDTTAAAADAQRRLLRVLLPFDDASFRALLSLDAVSARVEALFHPLDDPSYAGALVALTRETATMETAYHVWAEGGDPAKRRFTRAAKAVAMIAVYSDRMMWLAMRSVRNLPVCDASVFPTSCGANRMIAIMAMARYQGLRIAAEGARYA